MKPKGEEGYIFFPIFLSAGYPFSMPGLPIMGNWFPHLQASFTMNQTQPKGF